MTGIFVGSKLITRAYVGAAPYVAAAVQQPFATGDGVQTQFQLVSASGQAAVDPAVTDVHQTDWQGSLELVSQPRTNQLVWSNDFANAAWDGDDRSQNISCTPGQPAPDGSNNATLLRESANADSAYIYQLTPGPLPYRFSIYAKAFVSDRLVLAVGSSNSGAYAIFDLVNGVVSVQPTLPGVSATIRAAANGFFECALIAAVGSGGTLAVLGASPDDTIMSSPANPASSGVYVYGASCVSGDLNTRELIITGASSRTVTDYVQSGNGITLGQPLAQGGILDWTGQSTVNVKPVSQIYLGNTRLSPPMVLGDPKVAVITTGTSWTVPADWNNGSNTIECWGAGASGSTSGSGGGGGAWAKTDNVALTPGASVPYWVGGGSGALDTWFGAATYAASLCGAKGGNNTAGGGASACIGDAAYSGGNAAGGGGAAGYPGGPGGAGSGNNGGSGAAAGATTTGTAGASSVDGGGGGSKAAVGQTPGNGGAPGGGGGGAWFTLGAVGTGAPGQIRITYRLVIS